MDQPDFGFSAAVAMLGALVLAMAAAGVALARRAHFVITYRPGRQVQVRGRVPGSKVGAIKGFFARDLAPAARVSVRGLFGPGRTLKLRFRGPLSPGERQRVRNFLVDLLR